MAKVDSRNIASICCWSLLCNIYLNDLFYFVINVCNFADDENLKLNQDKCHLLVSVFQYKNVWAKIRKIKIWDNKKQKLLGVEIDRTLSFYEYITLTNMLESWKKISVLARLSNFMPTNKKRVLIKAFIESQFGY